ncbi:MAG: substrate-binding domain-containing protein [Candidatus Marinimicrobia bacterium]|nr:substrate-binding domain-containing protein [Candidatus Neomarinimicrobiota bacterium]
MESKKSFKRLVLSVFFFIILFTGCEDQTKNEIIHVHTDHQAKLFDDYITVDEFNQIHPKQIQLQKRFNQLIQKESTPVISGVQNQTVKIAFIYPGKQVSDYWIRSIKSFKARMDEIGIKYEIIEFFTRAGSVDIQKQEQIMKSVLKKNTDYLVFTMNVMKHKNLIERIVTKGRPKIFLQNITTPLRMWEGKQPLLYVGFDHVIGSMLLADYFIKKTNGKGNYAVLFFTEGYVSDMRGDTFINYLKNNSELKLKAAYYTQGQRNKAKQAVLNILKKSSDLEFIYTCSTDVALGAIDALKESGKLGTIEVNGWGGGSSELKSILDKEMDVTIMRMNDDNGVAMAEAIRLDIEGKTGQIPVIFSGDFTLIEKTISLNELNELQNRAFRYSGNN